MLPGEESNSLALLNGTMPFKVRLKSKIIISQHYIAVPEKSQGETGNDIWPILKRVSEKFLAETLSFYCSNLSITSP